MVSVLAFYSNDPSSNPAEVYNVSVKLLLKRTKINKKEAGLAHFFKKKHRKLHDVVSKKVLTSDNYNKRSFYLEFST